MIPQHTETIDAKIETDSKNIDSIALGYYLYIFSLLYSAIAKENRQLSSGVDIERHSVASVVDRFRSRKTNYRFLYHLEHNPLFLDERDRYFGIMFHDRLSIININRENPISVVFECIPIVLAAAVVISGGEYELGPLKVKLPPLGEGIKAIISAFRR